MKDNPIDPRLERLIASLYGELPKAEEQEIQRLLAEDPALRAEWEELRETRAILKGWEVEEAAPSFLVVGGESSGTAGTVGARKAARPHGRLWMRLARLAPAPAWGLAAAALLLAGLALADFQVQRVAGGIAFRFGDRAESPEVAVRNQPVGDETAPARPAAESASGAAIPAGRVTSERPDAGAPGAAERSGAASSGEAPYLTREEFKAYADGMARTMVALLNDYSERRDKDLSGALVSMYQELNQKQSFVYDDLRERIDAVGVGLVMEQTKTDVQLENLMDQGRGAALKAQNQSPIDSTEEK